MAADGRRVFAGVGAAALAAVLFAGAAQGQGLEQAEALRQQGKFREAAAAFVQALGAEPENPRALFGAGVCLSEAGRAENNLDDLWAARKHLEKLVTVAPAVAEYRYWNGTTAAQLIPYSASFAPMLRETAEAELRETLRLDPAHWDAQFQLGRLLEGKGDAAGAVEAYAKAVRMSPERLDPYPLLALGLLQLGRPEESVATARALLEKSPAYAFAHKIIGDALAAKPDFESARAEYLLGQEAEPANPLWCSSLRALFDRSSDAEGAAKLFGELTGKFPDLPAPRGEFASALAKCERHEDAAREYGELVRRFPGFYPYLQGFAASLEKVGREDEAVGAWLEALRILPADWANYGYEHPYTPLKKRFEGHRLAARFREAADLLRRVAEANPEPSLLCWVHWELSENLQQLRDAEGTFAALGKAIEIDPLEPRFRNSRGLFLITLGKNQEAIAEFKAALEISPGFMYSIENLAAAYHRIHDDANAKLWFLKGLECAREQLQMAGDNETRSEREFDVFKFNTFLHELEAIEAAKKAGK
jgi:tetratricopeptide (TPR) repeat protein